MADPLNQRKLFKTVYERGITPDSRYDDIKRLLQELFRPYEAQGFWIDGDDASRFIGYYNAWYDKEIMEPKRLGDQEIMRIIHRYIDSGKQNYAMVHTFLKGVVDTRLYQTTKTPEEWFVYYRTELVKARREQPKPKLAQRKPKQAQAPRIQSPRADRPGALRAEEDFPPEQVKRIQDDERFIAWEARNGTDLMTIEEFYARLPNKAAPRTQTTQQLYNEYKTQYVKNNPVKKKVLEQ
jgi:hypothetical protein